MVGLLALIALVGCGLEGRTHRAGSRSARTARVDVDHELEIAHDACPLKDRLRKEIPTWPSSPGQLAVETPDLGLSPVFSNSEILLPASFQRPHSHAGRTQGPRAPPLS
jgi:hypothetical protein